jgi:hypothetical protein
VAAVVTTADDSGAAVVRAADDGGRQRLPLSWAAVLTAASGPGP